MHAYRLTLTISGQDSNSANDSKINESAEFSATRGSSDADLEALDIRRFREDGTSRMRGLVRNMSSQNYAGERKARLYFIDQTGGQNTATLIASEVIKNVGAGDQWEIDVDVPVHLLKVKTYTLKLMISAGDRNKGNDEKSKSFVALD